jgi:hypothetical protein
MVRIIRCTCGHSLYMGGTRVTCPACFKEIHLNQDNAYLVSGEIPIINIYKFHPSDLKYFEEEFPKDGEKILGIFDDNTAEFFEWKETFVDWYEHTVQEGNVKSLLFSWKPLITNKRGDII